MDFRVDLRADLVAADADVPVLRVEVLRVDALRGEVLRAEVLTADFVAEVLRVDVFRPAAVLLAVVFLLLRRGLELVEPLELEPDAADLRAADFRLGVAPLDLLAAFLVELLEVVPVREPALRLDLFGDVF